MEEVREQIWSVLGEGNKTGEEAQGRNVPGLVGGAARRKWGLIRENQEEMGVRLRRGLQGTERTLALTQFEE